MKICGLKLTHDGSVALIENGKLIFSCEMEKLNNNHRFTSIEKTEDIPRLLSAYGYSIDDIDIFAIDGWGGDDQDSLAVQPRLEIGEKHNWLSIIEENGKTNKIGIGRYSEATLKGNILEEWEFNSLVLNNRKIRYKSYLHAAGHLFSTYCTSEFSKLNEPSFILIWDGGMFPRLYYFDPVARNTLSLGPIFLMIGNIYTIFAQHFGPFKVEGNFAKDNLSVAGKVMAYIALGQIREELFEYFDEIYNTCYDMPMGFANIFANEFKKRIKNKGFNDEDILCTFHVYLEKMLIKKLRKKIERSNLNPKNLCISGGCALNIKWNSAIRNANIFDNVYVPPFPNDSGSAIGTACCAMILYENRVSLDWNVYKGPQIIDNSDIPGWNRMPCSIRELAKLLHESNEPVVFLNGNAELGPRALGNRSIIASPEDIRMKDILNKIKEREKYRPVSPICLEEKASEIFIPGIKDPYMLFDHKVKEEWVCKIPAVIHLDKTARLQTVSKLENGVIHELLIEYEKLSGIPLLCNTSANYKGSGFFPDVKSAAEWGRTNYIFCRNNLYIKTDKVQL